MSDEATTPTLGRKPATVHLADGTTLEVVVANPDMARWDMTAHTHKWPSMSDAPILWATFTTWHAAKRTGLIDVTFETWRDEMCLQVVMPQGGDDDDEVGPTR